MKKYLIALAVVGLTTTSCYEKLNITPPNQITDEQVRELLATADEKTAASVMGGIANPLTTCLVNESADLGSDTRYNKYSAQLAMRSFEGNDIVFGDLSRGNSGASLGFGVNEYKLNDISSASSDKNYAYWVIGWKWVTKANKVLNMLDDKTVGTNQTLKNYKAWGLFVRAYAYNYLLENYQKAYMQGGKDKLGMPWYSKYDPTQAYLPRLTMQATYDSINKDLDGAIAILTADKGIGFTADKSDIDAGVAYFLKARISLCTGQWQAAADACKMIIDKAGTSWMKEAQYVGTNVPEANGKAQYYAVNSGFMNLAQNPETILGWPTAQAGGNAQQSFWFNVYGLGMAGSIGYNIRIDDRIYNMIPGDDYRQKNFNLTPPDADYPYANGTNMRILPYSNLKFACTVGTNGGKDPSQAVQTSTVTDFTLMRRSEVYLMMAEAQAQLGQDGTAKETLGALLTARGTNYEAYASKNPGITTVLDMVKLQWRVEMWGENGLEFYNNKRWNVPVNRANSTVHWQMNTLSVADMTLKLPLQATNFNGLLIQNED